MKHLFAVVVSLCFVSLLGCSSGRDSSTASRRSSEDTSTAQLLFDSQIVTYLLPQGRVRLADQLNQFVEKLARTPPPKSTLVCMQTEEINGLFLCIGSNKLAQHIPLNRPAIYIEGRPVLGVQSSRQIVSSAVSESGYQQSSGHDLTQAHLEEFFVAAKRLCPDLSCLNDGEKVFAEKVMPAFMQKAGGAYSVVSVDVSDLSNIKRALSHEISHGQFFQELGYRNAAYAFWNSVSPVVQLAAKSLLASNYDVNNPELLINEFHAFTLDGTFESIPEAYIIELQRTNQAQAQILALLRDGAAQRRVTLFNLLSTSTRVVWGAQLAR
ncbi:MAG: hypothetical protein FJY29_04690 [Betaproteobacteria bacterium]|nr:hypothetical protein [Betaproteobacteria bacterium]